MPVKVCKHVAFSILNLLPVLKTETTNAIIFQISAVFWKTIGGSGNTLSVSGWLQSACKEGQPFFRFPQPPTCLLIHPRSLPTVLASVVVTTAWICCQRSQALVLAQLATWQSHRSPFTSRSHLQKEILRGCPRRCSVLNRFERVGKS